VAELDAAAQRRRRGGRKQDPGTEIAISGGATLVRSLLGEGLIDELRLLVYPVVLGSGGRLFEPGTRARPSSSSTRRRSRTAS
jgi:dihydrofolate reductase